MTMTMTHPHCIVVLRSCSCCCHWHTVIFAIMLYCCILFFMLFFLFLFLLLLLLSVVCHQCLLLCRCPSVIIHCHPLAPSCCNHGVLLFCLFCIVSHCVALCHKIILLYMKGAKKFGKIFVSASNERQSSRDSPLLREYPNNKIGGHKQYTCTPNV